MGGVLVVVKMGSSWNADMTDSKTTVCHHAGLVWCANCGWRASPDLVREALRVATAALDYALYHGGPDLYDGVVPNGWEGTLDIPGSNWPIMARIVEKCREILDSNA